MKNSKFPQQSQEEAENYLKRLGNLKKPIMPAKRSDPAEEPSELSDSAAFLQHVKQLAKQQSQLEPQNNTLSALPDELTRNQGVISDFCDYCDAISHRKNRALSFAGGLAFCSLIFGRNFILSGGLDTPMNLFIIAFGNSGSGKGTPQKAIRRLLKKHTFERLPFENEKRDKKKDDDGLDVVEDSLLSSVCGTFGSGEGLADRLAPNIKLLSIIDECQTLFKKKLGKDDSTVIDVMIDVFSKSDDFFIGRSLANPDGKRKGLGKPIERPFFNLLAFGIRDIVYPLLGTDEKVGGLMGRTLFISGEAEVSQNTPKDPDPPSSLFNLLCYAAEQEQEAAFSGGLRTQNKITLTTDAENKLNEMKKAVVDKINSLEADHMKRAIFNRYSEIVLKLAQIHAVSLAMSSFKFTEGNVPQVILTPENLDWGSKVWAHSFNTVIKTEEEHGSEDEIYTMRKIGELFTQENGDKLTEEVKILAFGVRDLLRKTRKYKKVKELEEVLEDMQGRGLVELFRQDRKRLFNLTPEGLVELERLGAITFE